MNANSALFGRIQLQHHSVNNLIQWGDHLSVEHPEIDAQHKALFDLGTELYENWRGGGSVHVLRPAVDKLAKLLEDHFSYEEKLLVEIGYSNLDEHVAEHHSMLNDMKNIKGRIHTFEDGHKFSGGSLLAPGWPVLQLILELAIGHVMNGDMAYCSALVANRNRAQGIS
jgi:hemerythrin